MPEGQIPQDHSFDGWSCFFFGGTAHRHRASEEEGGIGAKAISRACIKFFQETPPSVQARLMRAQGEVFSLQIPSVSSWEGFGAKRGRFQIAGALEGVFLSIIPSTWPPCLLSSLSSSVSPFTIIRSLIKLRGCRGPVNRPSDITPPRSLAFSTWWGRGRVADDEGNCLLLRESGSRSE